MHAFLVVSNATDDQEKELTTLLDPFSIHPLDIIRVSPKRTIGIDTVREIKRLVWLKPFKGKTKAVVIEDANALTIEAQNALLKTLEEPPDNTIIILLTTNADLLLPTIVSRCQVIEVSASGNWQLATGELEARSKELVAILESKVGERLTLAEAIGKDRETALAWLEKVIIAVRQTLMDTIGKEKPPTTNILVYLQWLKSFHKAHAMLSTTNVNPRFTLEILFLSFPFNNSGTIQS